MKNNLKIMVTGAAGFIGSHLVDYLLSKDNIVIGLDNLSNGTMRNLENASDYKNFSFIKSDILNLEDCINSCKDVDIVYHLACLGVRHSLHNPIENHKVNAEGTLNMLEASRKNSVKQFFYISTSEVYGKVDQFPISETALPVPITVYGSSKLVGEHYTNSYRECFGLNSTVIRIFNNYGPRAHFEGDSGEVIPRTIVNFLNGKNATLFGDGNITRDFYYVKDTARILGNMIGNEKIVGKLFNLGTSCEIKIGDVIKIISNLMIDYNPKIENLPDRPADVPRLWVNNNKISQLIDISSEISFSKGILNTISYYKKLHEIGDLVEEVPKINW